MDKLSNQDLIQQSLARKDELNTEHLSRANALASQRISSWVGKFSAISFSDAHHVGRIILAAETDQEHGATSLHEAVHVSRRIGDRPQEAFKSVLSDGLLSRLENAGDEVKEMRRGLSTSHEALFFHRLKLLQPDCQLMQHVSDELNTGRTFQEIFSNPDLAIIKEATKNEIRETLELMRTCLNDRLAKDILHNPKTDPVLVLMERASLRSSIEQEIKNNGMNLAPPTTRFKKP